MGVRHPTRGAGLARLPRCRLHGGPGHPGPSVSESSARSQNQPRGRGRARTRSQNPLPVGVGGLIIGRPRRPAPLVQSQNRPPWSQNRPLEQGPALDPVSESTPKVSESAARREVELASGLSICLRARSRSQNPPADAVRGLRFVPLEARSALAQIPLSSTASDKPYYRGEVSAWLTPQGSKTLFFDAGWVLRGCEVSALVRTGRPVRIILTSQGGCLLPSRCSCCRILIPARNSFDDLVGPLHR